MSDDASVSQPLAETVAAAPVNDRYSQARLGSQLTPQVISPILREADMGRMWRLADLLDEIREGDPHLQAVLAKREQQVAGAKYEVLAVEGGGRRAETIAQFVTEMLARIPNLTDTFAHLQSGVYHGRAAVENVWGTVATPKGERFVPLVCLPIHPRRLGYNGNQDWRLRLWDALGTTGGNPDLARFPGMALDESAPGKWIVHTPRVRGGYPTREGLGRPLLWMVAFKRFVLRDAMALAEMSGRMARIGKWHTGADGKPKATPEHVAKLRQALNEWSSAVSLIVPDTTEVAFVLPVTGNTIHHPLIELFNGEVSKAALGGTLTTDAGHKGARALGDTQSDEQDMIARWDAGGIAESLKRGLIEPAVVYNFGERARALCPTINFIVEPPESLDKLATRIVALVQGGLDLSQNDVRDMLGLRHPAPTDVLMVPRTGPHGGALAGGGTDPADPTDKPPGKPGAKPGDAPAAE